MNKILVLICCLFSGGFSGLFAQQNCGDNGTRTNPDNPFDLRALPPNSTQFLNNGKFDWRQPYYQWWNSATTTYSPDISSPFTTINNPNLVGYIDKLPADNKPEDGWELITYNFGKFYNGTFQTVDHPYFFLYNRYTGILRIFVYYNMPLANQDYQSARIRLSFKSDALGSNQSAILSHAERFTIPLDSYQKKESFGAINELLITSGQWLVADFPMAYDPCTCLNSYELLKVQVDLILNSTIDLQGKITTAEDLKVNNKVVSGNFPNDFKGGLTIKDINLASFNEAVKVGQKSYKSADDFRKELDRLAQKEKSSQTATRMLYDINNEFAPVLQIIPYVGAAIGIIDFFVSGGKSTDKNSLTPQTFEADVNLSGAIETTVNATDVLFVVPGSIPPTGVQDNYIPMYNEVLGIFNLLETPELEFVDYTWTNWSLNHCDQGRIILPAVRQFKVKKPIKFAVNPAAHLEIEKFDATFTITYGQEMFDGGIAKKTDLFETQIYNATTNTTQFSSTERIFPRPFEEFPFLSNPALPYEDRLNRIGMGIETWNNDWPNSGEVVLNTSYIPVGGIQDQSFMLYRDAFYTSSTNFLYCYDGLGRYPDPHIRFKVDIVFKRTDDPSAQKISFIATYEVKLTPNPLMNDFFSNFQFNPFLETGGLPIHNPGPVLTSLNNFPPLGTEYPNHLRMPVDITLENTTINDPSVIAIRSIHVGNNVSVNPNLFGISFQAGRSVTFEPTNTFSPIMVVSIAHPLPSFNLIPESLKTTNFTDICGNTSSYNPIVNSKWGNNTELVSTEKKSYNIDAFYSIYPNPAHSQTNIYYSTISANEKVRLSVLDVMGKEYALLVDAMQDQGEHTYVLNTQQLPTGIYFCRLERNGEIITKKFTVLK